MIIFKNILTLKNVISITLFSIIFFFKKLLSICKDPVNLSMHIQKQILAGVVLFQWVLLRLKVKIVRLLMFSFKFIH